MSSWSSAEPWPVPSWFNHNPDEGYRGPAVELVEHYLLGTAGGYEEVLADAATDARERVSAVADRVTGQPPPSGERVADILLKVQALQERVGHPGDYPQWIDRVRLPQV